MGIEDLLEEIYEDEKTPMAKSANNKKNNKRTDKKNGDELPFVSNIKISNVKNYNVALKNIVKSRYEIETRKLFERFDQIQRTKKPEEFRALLIPLLNEYEKMYKSAEDDAKKLKTYIDIFLTKNEAIYLPGISEKLSNLKIRLTDPFNDFHPSLSENSETKRIYRESLIKMFMGIDKNIKETIKEISNNLSAVVQMEKGEFEKLYKFLYCWVLYGNLIMQFTNKTIEINRLEALAVKKNNEKRNNKRREQRGGKKDKKKGQKGDKGEKKSSEDIMMDNLITKIRDFEKWESSNFIKDELGNRFVNEFFNLNYLYNDVNVNQQLGINGKYQFGEFENIPFQIGEKIENEEMKNLIRINLVSLKTKNIINMNEILNYDKIDAISRREITIKLKDEQKNTRAKIDGIFIKVGDDFYKVSPYELEKLFKQSDGLKEYYKNYSLRNFNLIKLFSDEVSRYRNNIIKNSLYYSIFTLEYLGEFIKIIRNKYNIPVEIKPKEVNKEQKENENKGNKGNKDNKEETVNKTNKKKYLEELQKERDELYKEREGLRKKLKEKISNDERNEINELIEEISSEFEEIRKEIQKIKNNQR
jgi:hypothetical protein